LYLQKKMVDERLHQEAMLPYPDIDYIEELLEDELIDVFEKDDEFKQTALEWAEWSNDIQIKKWKDNEATSITCFLIREKMKKILLDLLTENLYEELSLIVLKFYFTIHIF